MENKKPSSEIDGENVSKPKKNQDTTIASSICEQSDSKLKQKKGYGSMTNDIHYNKKKKGNMINISRRMIPYWKLTYPMVQGQTNHLTSS